MGKRMINGVYSIMERNTIAEMKSIIEAIEQGNPIQFFDDVKNVWCDTTNTRPNFRYHTYRVKPYELKKKYRPFKDTEELFAHNKGHDILWLKVKDSGTCRLVSSYNDKTVQFNTASSFNMTELLVAFTFKDGAPCGVEEGA